MRVRFSNKILSVEADTLGAELVSVKAHGRERLWQNGSGEWSGHAPVLFPVCGRSAVRVNGEDYPIERHGFARTSEFTLKMRRKSSVCFELSSSDATRAQYPFDFVFRVRYLLRGERLHICYEVENPSNSVLYFSCGGHESFALERPLCEYELRFPKRETFSSLLHNDQGLITGESIDFGEGQIFALPESFLSEGRTIIFKDLRSRKLRLCEHGGRPLAKIAFGGFSNLLLWRAGSALFLCIEPWHNLPDREEPREISVREGMIAVTPHGKKKLVRTITYLK